MSGGGGSLGGPGEGRGCWGCREPGRSTLGGRLGRRVPGRGEPPLPRARGLRNPPRVLTCPSSLGRWGHRGPALPPTPLGQVYQPRGELLPPRFPGDTVTASGRPHALSEGSVRPAAAPRAGPPSGNAGPQFPPLGLGWAWWKRPAPTQSGLVRVPRGYACCCCEGSCWRYLLGVAHS